MYAEVIVDYSNNDIDRVFDYKVPESFLLECGQRVTVPFGKSKVLGFVLKIKETTEYDESKVKEIISVIDETPIIIPEMLELLFFMREKYHLRIIDVLRLFLPAEMRSGKVKDLTKTICKINENFEIEEYKKSLRKNSKNLLGCIDYLLEHKSEDKTILAEKFNYQTVKKLIEIGFLNIEEEKVYRKPNSTEKENILVKYTDMQTNAINIISQKKDRPVVLFGVTGSGKTEVYLASIRKALDDGKTAIMLVPEISLTPQVFSLFKARFGDEVAILHSGLSAGERFDEWNRLLSGKAKIAIGARSAIFAPLKNVGIIIIDEEHDSSYISESNPRYNTHDIALFRKKYNSSALVLGSATPDLDTFNRAIKGEYNLVELPKRVNNKEMPPVQIVDMLSEIRNGNTGIFSNALLYELQAIEKNNKQAMLFINRRGFTSFMRCNECGYIAKCENCDVSLVYHKAEEKLKCHYCGKRYKALTVCPKCGSHYIRQGAVGTQKVVDELEKLFPNIKVFRMDNDSTKNKNSHQQILEEFGKTKPAILVGTQMIAKGHDFKDVVLVGIIDADQSLYQSDYRSTERTFQLITQVSGRAGRSESDGKVILQTYAPKHYIYRFVANYNYKAFFDKEINIREVTHFPPFSQIARVLFSGNNEELVKNIVKQCYNEMYELSIKYKDDFIYFDAMKSPIGRINNQFRYQILMRYYLPNMVEIKQNIYRICDNLKNGKVNIFVEINPQNLS